MGLERGAGDWFNRWMLYQDFLQKKGVAKEVSWFLAIKSSLMNAIGKSGLSKAHLAIFQTRSTSREALQECITSQYF